jgi:2'-5' RNA ligase
VVGELRRRVFLAVDLPEAERRLLAAVVAEWTGGKPLPGRPVPPESWHLTLRFVGWVSPVEYDRLLAGVAALDLGRRFRVGIGTAGAFPNPRRATVLWLDVLEGGLGLTRLAEQVEEVVEAIGFEPEGRPYRPHLTISRIRPDQDVRGLLERYPAGTVEFAAEAVTLFESHLGRGGARYEALERFALA